MQTALCSMSTGVENMYDDRLVVVSQKSSGFSIWKLIGVFACICAIPFLCFLIIPLGCLGGVAAFIGAIVAVQNYGLWALGAILAIPIVLALRDRVSGKHGVKALRVRIAQLETELLEARHNILLLEEEKEFVRKLESTDASHKGAKRG